MRLIAWNIRAGGGRRVAQIAHQIERWQPDLITLSEFRATLPSQTLAGYLADMGLSHQLNAINPAKPATNGLLLAARHPLSRLDLPHAPQEPHRWLLAQVLTNRPFWFGAMHIPNYVTGRKGAFHQAVLAVTEAWQAVARRTDRPNCLPEVGPCASEVGGRASEVARRASEVAP